MNRKGSSFTDMFLILAILMVVVLFMAGFMFGFNQLSDVFIESELTFLGNNVSDVGEDTFVVINRGLGGLQWIAIALFFGMVIAILVSNFLVRPCAIVN